jgi:antitoxin component YwqK of YwqJK toxin-antitoxin module
MSETGVIRTYYDNEKTKLHEEYFEVNGKKEGIYKQYWKNGNLKEICNYINGEMNGIYKLYYETGPLFRICNYINYKKNGIYKTYCYNGQLISEVNYVDDEIDEIVKILDDVIMDD